MRERERERKKERERMPRIIALPKEKIDMHLGKRQMTQYTFKKERRTYLL